MAFFDISETSVLKELYSFGQAVIINVIDWVA